MLRFPQHFNVYAKTHNIFTDADVVKPTTQTPAPKAVNQAARIFKKFGNARKLAKAMGRTPSTLYRWTYEKKRGGTGGLIPSSALPAVLEAARCSGIFISADDLFPGLR